MIFNSLTFLVFLVITVILYWVLPRTPRLWLIFLSSLTFYGFWRWEFLPILMLSTVIDYVIALAIDKTPKIKKQKRLGLLLISLVINLGLLIYFKYTFFILDNFRWFSADLNVWLDSGLLTIILPLGISFYTFQTISYTIDVYRGHERAERNFVLYGCYVTFFPQLVAGPILRSSEVTSQLSTRPGFKSEFLVNGLKRILYGFFLKVVLADNIAPLVDETFSLNIGQLGGIDVWTMAFLFGFQIYFDFAGYSHIAIGCANLLGIDFPENFNFPYAARSFKSFWKRWHISLSSWIRDYLYLPLCGIKVIDPEQRSEGGISVDKTSANQFKKNRGLFLTWAIMGLWHGANWTFVFWGIYHALIIYLERTFAPVRQKVGLLATPLVGWLITAPLAMLGWIPFRALNLSDTLFMYGQVLNPLTYTKLGLRENLYLVAFLLFLLITLAYLIHTYAQQALLKYRLVGFGFEVAKYAIMIFLIFTFFRPISQFIYFQF